MGDRCSHPAFPLRPSPGQASAARTAITPGAALFTLRSKHLASGALVIVLASLDCVCLVVLVRSAEGSSGKEKTARLLPELQHHPNLNNLPALPPPHYYLRIPVPILHLPAFRPRPHYCLHQVDSLLSTRAVFSSRSCLFLNFLPSILPSLFPRYLSDNPASSHSQALQGPPAKYF